MKWKHGILVGVCALGLVATVSCGGDDEGGGDGDGDGGDGDINIGNGGVISTLDACDTDTDCEGSARCHPVVRGCVAPGSECSSSDDCAAGQYCDVVSSTCLPGLAGSPCDGDDNCEGGSTCTGGICACSGFIQEQEGTAGPLDIYFIFDRTASMDNDCQYVPGQDPPEQSKACFATYAMSDYLINVQPATDTRLAFQFMSYDSDDGDDGLCDAPEYSNPLVGLTTLPVPEDHQIVQEISDEQFEGGFGTQIAGALRGMADFTVSAQEPGREMIGVLMTDGDANRCDVQDAGGLADIIAGHREQTGIRTFIIGMEGATEENLEEMAIAGGAEPHDDFCGSIGPPCHYWNVGDGSGEAIADALTAIAGQATPFACDYELANIQPQTGEELDLATMNIQLTQGGVSTTIVNVAGEDACPANDPAWYFEGGTPPTSFTLCETACDLVSSATNDATMSIVSGCVPTVVATR